VETDGVHLLEYFTSVHTFWVSVLYLTIMFNINILIFYYLIFYI